MRLFLLTVAKTEVIEAVDIAGALRHALKLTAEFEDATEISIEEVTDDDDA